MGSTGNQQIVCSKYGAKYTPVEVDQLLGVAKGFYRKALPIHGLRHPAQGGTTGWYIWTGELGAEEDFFEPHHVEHISKISPEVLPYLALPPGWRFLIGENGYVDVWYDKDLLNV